MLLISYLLRSGLYFSSRLTLGGGMGLLSGEHGLVIDNLVKVVYLLDHVISAEISLRLQSSPQMGLF